MLIDTCAWVDYYSVGHSGNGRKKVDQQLVAFMDHHIDSRGKIFTTPLVMQEFMHGLSNEKQYRSALLAFQTYDLFYFDNQYEATIEAINLGHTCLRKGLTVRSPNDCMIALIALTYDLPLLTKDRDFENIAKVFPLELVDYGKL